VAGLVAAATEMVIVLPVQAGLGASPVRVFQFIASGLLGKAAYTAGSASVLLGVGVHVAISLVAAAAFVVGLLMAAPVRRHPLAGGALFGVGVYVVMTLVVVPLSRIGSQPLPPLPLAAVSLAVHVLAFGVPLALTAAWSLRRASARADLRIAS
jgi:uncharacterized membrane protein YagU involved in acid resistance